VNPAVFLPITRIRQLRKFRVTYATVEQRGDWDINLPLAMSAYNKSKHSSTGFSPHELVFGQRPNLPNDVLQEMTYNEYKFLLEDKLKFLHICARQNIKKAQEATKIGYDKKSHIPYIKEGDMIMVKKNNRKSKLEERYKGPYEVTHTSTTGVTIKNKEKEEKVHFKNIKPYHMNMMNLFITLFLMLFFAPCGFMQKIIEPLHTNHGLLFLNKGIVMNNIDSWNLVTTFDTTIL